MNADSATAGLLQVHRGHPLHVVTWSAWTATGLPVHLRRILPLWAVTGCLNENPFLDWLDLVAVLAGMRGEITANDLADDDVPHNPDYAVSLGIEPGGRAQQTTRLVLAAGRPVITQIHRTRTSTPGG